MPHGSVNMKYPRISIHVAMLSITLGVAGPYLCIEGIRYYRLASQAADEAQAEPHFAQLAEASRICITEHRPRGKYCGLCIPVDFIARQRKPEDAYWRFKKMEALYARKRQETLRQLAHFW
jgi:hypothetical protein